MPCYTPSPKEERKLGQKRKEKDWNENQSDKVKVLEAQLCALINELDRRGIAQEVIQDANKNGNVSLDEFWDMHLKQDEIRIAGIIRGLSFDEQQLLKRILDESLEGKSKFHNPATSKRKSFVDRIKNP